MNKKRRRREMTERETKFKLAKVICKEMKC